MTRSASSVAPPAGALTGPADERPSADPANATSPAAPPDSTSPTATRPGRWHPVRDYGVLTVVVGALTAAFYRPWQGGWGTPLTTGGDTYSVLAMLDGVGFTGTASGSATLGAPYGLSWIDFPLGPDRAHLIVFRALRALTGDPVVALNLAFGLGFLTVAWASFAVLRRLGITPMVAGAVSVAFTFAPYHFARVLDGHLFLSAYYAVPLGVLLVIWAGDGVLGRHLPRGRAVAVVAMVLLIGSSSAYYAAFTIVLAVGSGLALAVRRAELRVLVVSVLVAGAIGVVVVANTAGDLFAARAAGANPEAAARPVADSDAFGLRLAQLVLPSPGHRIPAMAELGGRATEHSPGESGAAIGLLGLVGLVGVAAVAVRRVGRPARPGRDGEEDALMVRLGVLAGVGVVAATAGSLGLLVALVGFGQIRVWGRMSIVLAFLGLTGSAVLLDRLLRTDRLRATSIGSSLVAIAVIALVVVDQVGMVPDRSEVASAWSGDRELATQLEGALDDGAAVFQLPHVEFPSADPPGDLPVYGLLGPWAAGSGDLRFSAAGMQGRAGDWQRTWSQQPPEVLVAGLSAAGFDALVLDRRSEAGNQGSSASTGTAVATTGPVADWLGRTLGPPTGEVGQGSEARVWYDLRPVRAQLVEQLGPERAQQLGEAVRRPIGVTFSGAADRFALAGGDRALHDGSTLTLRRESGDGFGDEPTSVVVRFTLWGEPGTTAAVTADGTTQEVAFPERVDGDGGADRLASAEVELRVALDERDTTIRFDAGDDGAADVRAGRGDPPLAISPVQVLDADLDRAIERGELRVR